MAGTSGKIKFPDYAAPTRIAYVQGHPAELHLRKCKLVWHQGGQVHERMFDQSVITLGAMDDNDLVVREDTVSRYHCKVIQDRDGWVLLDLDSTNGTSINGVRVREAFLRPGCTVLLGEVELKFFFADEKVRIVPSDRDRLGHLVGRSIRMREIYGIIEKIARTNTTVVIEGETGTGKEVVAKTIHELSDRAASPMMVFDCGAVPENLIESELFGHEKGSFTNAIATRQGIVETAHRGTLFLDEVGELTPELQPKLLRALEQREIRRVGSNKPIKVDVRVIAATNRNLEEEVREGRFREDLYYRLSVVRFEVPPLRERREDIPLLIEHLLTTQRFNRPDGRVVRVEDVDPDAMRLLTAYTWPGNVRELVNVIERAVSFSEGQRIEPDDLPMQIRAGAGGASMSAPVTGPLATDGSFKDAKERWIASFERDYIVDLLKKNNGNISHAARDADIDRKYLRKLMRKYDIDAPLGADEE